MAMTTKQLALRRRLLLLLGLLLLIVAPPVSHAGIFGGPAIDGDSYKYDGKGKQYTTKDAFSTDDTYNTISLTNWDMSDVAELPLPHSVQTLTLSSCQLCRAPAEIDALENLSRLNLVSNNLTTVGETFASGTKLTVLNLTQNSLTEFNAVLPALQILDLSANAFESVPLAIFQLKQLTSLYLTGNGVQIQVVTEDQFDFYAGLSDFEADFADVSTCTDGGELVALKGAHVCRVHGATLAPVVPMVPMPLARQATTAPAPVAVSVVPNVPVSPARVTEPTAKRGNEDDDHKTTFIAYGMVFVLLAAGCIGGLYKTLVRRHTAKLRGVLHEETPLFFDSDARSDYYTQELVTGDRLFPSNDPVLVTWRLDYDAVKFTKRIAKGAFGEVWVGRYRGNKVAVKKLLDNGHGGSYEASEDFIREIKLLAWLKHPKIVQFIGVAWTRLVDMMAVTEFMDSGDLRSYLDATSKKKKTNSWTSVKLQFALDTIDALVYLHSSSPLIIHRDLKSRNILVDSRKRAKLGDFGISAMKRDRDMTTGVGTTRWLAPELARGDPQYTEAVDIYAFGVILSELDTHKLPFYDAQGANGDKLSDFGILRGVASGELSVKFTRNCPENLRLLAQRCVAFEPKDRPTAAQVAYELRKKDLLLGGTTGGLV